MKRFSQKISLILISLLLFSSFSWGNLKGILKNFSQLVPGVRAQAVSFEPNFSLNSFLKQTFLSPEIKADFPFNALEIFWEEEIPLETSLEIWVRFKEKDGKWNDWFMVEKEIDFKDGEEDLNEKSNLVLTNLSRSFQYKVILKSENEKLSPFLKKLNFKYLDSTWGGEEIVSNQSDQLESETAERIDPKRIDYLLAKLQVVSDSFTIISREEWGGDENYRMTSGEDEEEAVAEEAVAEETGEIETNGGKNNEADFYQQYQNELELERVIETDENGEELIWPLQYAKKVQKIIIHHTATTKNLDDPEAAIRAIYYYHAISRGWGDIGYNYIIDLEGNIYEGRFGGEKVVGGHATGFNTGSIGIAVLGNYSEKEPPAEVLKALLTLIDAKVRRYQIDPEGQSRFRGEVLPNIIGHQDVEATACPGAKLYQKLPYLRKLLAYNLELDEVDLETLTQEEFAFEEVSDREMVVLAPESETEIEIQVKNTGTQIWDKSTYLVANQNSGSSGMIDLNKKQDRPSIADLEEEKVAPGEVGTFKVKINSSLISGLIYFDLTPIFNGYKKTSHYLALPVYVEEAELNYEVEKVYFPSSRLKSGREIEGWIELKNTGNVIWRKTGGYYVTLGTSHPEDRRSLFLNHPGNRWGSLVQEEVKPGEIGRFEIALKGPEEAGLYQEYFTPVLEGLKWFEDQGTYFEILVYNDQAQAKFIARSETTDFAPGETQNIWIELQNIGSLTWTDSGRSQVKTGLIKNPKIKAEALSLDQTQVKLGETAKLEFAITAPQTPGQYVVYFRPRVRGQNLVKKPLYFRFTVKEEIQEEMSAKGPKIRIALTDTPANPIIKGNGNFDLYANDKLIHYFTQDDQVQITYQDNLYQLRSGPFAWVFEDYPRFVPRAEAILEIANFDHQPAWNLDLNDNRYRGILEVRYLNSALTIINELPMEDYLKGIGEVSNSHPTEKIRTIIILARTYAHYYLEKEEKFPGKPYDLNDRAEDCQKYLGYGLEIRSPDIKKAVEDTEGLVVTYQGEIVKTPYFNQSDGTYTKSAQEIWGWTDTPWLQSVPDPLCGGDHFEGHGVGLSGCGAEEAAKQGKTYEEIIKYYYLGVEIEKIY